MLAWKLTLKTPEYPAGRELILIANDVTFQAGSFGVKEDQFFQKASELARVRGLPRIYVSCNSGARVGLVEELKPLYKAVQWIDAADCGKGGAERGDIGTDLIPHLPPREGEIALSEGTMAMDLAAETQAVAQANHQAAQAAQAAAAALANHAPIQNATPPIGQPTQTPTTVADLYAKWALENPGTDPMYCGIAEREYRLAPGHYAAHQYFPDVPYLRSLIINPWHFVTPLPNRDQLIIRYGNQVRSHATLITKYRETITARRDEVSRRAANPAKYDDNLRAFADHTENELSRVNNETTPDLGTYELPDIWVCLDKSRIPLVRFDVPVGRILEEVEKRRPADSTAHNIQGLSSAGTPPVPTESGVLMASAPAAESDLQPGTRPAGVPEHIHNYIIQKIGHRPRIELRGSDANQATSLIDGAVLSAGLEWDRSYELNLQACGYQQEETFHHNPIPWPGRQSEPGTGTERTESTQNPDQFPINEVFLQQMKQILVSSGKYSSSDIDTLPLGELVRLMAAEESIIGRHRDCSSLIANGFDPTIIQRLTEISNQNMSLLTNQHIQQAMIQDMRASSAATTAQVGYVAQAVNEQGQTLTQVAHTTAASANTLGTVTDQLTGVNAQLSQSANSGASRYEVPTWDLALQTARSHGEQGGTLPVRPAATATAANASVPVNTAQPAQIGLPANLFAQMLGFEYLYLLKADYEKLPPGSVEADAGRAARRSGGVHKIAGPSGEERFVLDAIIGEGMKSTKPGPRDAREAARSGARQEAGLGGGIGVENLQGSGLIAGETSRAYQERCGDTFTLSYITGRSVGIGAYLNRLGQRNIQMVSSPMILTGYAALNKLLGKNVYQSQDQLGGPQIMVPNGVTHQVVRDDQEGMAAILDWLSFVPKARTNTTVCGQPSGVDPWDRDVDFEPSQLPYDPRDFLRGVIDHEGNRMRGFFDAGSWVEYLEGWGRTVITGRARLGGIPMGVIAVETRSVDRLVPADPSNPESCEVKESMGGKVWFPDSAFKTAQALKDFNRGENLPVIIFANWRGFSGGTRDMYNEILKFGAMIVDALVEYKHPIFIYIPKHGELRGGAWVVIDPAINPEKMEMYADLEARGGILEPPGIVEVKYRAPQQANKAERRSHGRRRLQDPTKTWRVGRSGTVLFWGFVGFCCVCVCFAARIFFSLLLPLDKIMEAMIDCFGEWKVSIKTYWNCR
ncbi:Acetyl-CoA carboxylase [Durusdinium trenchii]|uniref:Mitochondrial (ACC) n=1 Tax=Durusdinium trenchii TaxID=1381693 RepID=A0ABP0QXD5_9DINO